MCKASATAKTILQTGQANTILEHVGLVPSQKHYQQHHCQRIKYCQETRQNRMKTKEWNHVHVVHYKKLSKTRSRLLVAG
mmetsp:Transcript_26594/g.56191  ORF Transcript_26594/g.56191 Transcript_26594/m.56191 type:complete len:80 (-) Transcript_26594:1003-1242(-)